MLEERPRSALPAKISHGATLSIFLLLLAILGIAFASAQPRKLPPAFVLETSETISVASADDTGLPLHPVGPLDIIVSLPANLPEPTRSAHCDLRGDIAAAPQFCSVAQARGPPSGPAG